MLSPLDHPLLTSRYFFPRRSPVDAPFEVTAADGVSRLACYRSAPHEGALTLLHFHGNAEIVADYVPEVARTMNGLGLNAFFAEYRGYGGSTGAPSLGAMLDDSEVVFRALGVPASRVIAFGRSLGSLFAVEVASRHRDLAGLVLESAIADPLEPGLARVSAEDLGVSDQELVAAVRARFDQAAKLASYPGPLLVMHTSGDLLIPPSHAQRNWQSGGAPPGDKELVMFAQGDHGSIYPVNHAEYIARLGAFVEKVRARPA